MEIRLLKKGDMHILGVKGKLRVQNWPVLDKHLDALLAGRNRLVAMDVSEVSLVCSVGVGTIMHNVRKFREQGAVLMVVATRPYMQEIFRLFGCESAMGGSLCTDWESLEKHLRSPDPAAAA